MDLLERYEEIQAQKRELKESFRDNCGCMVFVYGGYGVGWEVQRVTGNQVTHWYFKKRVDANKIIFQLKRK